MSALTPAALLTPDFVAALPPEARAVLPYLADVWLRPEQRVDWHGKREIGFLAGRGWGKTFAAANVLVEMIAELGPIMIGLMAPTEEIAKSVQFAALVEVSPIWFKPETKGDRLIWPNGATARMFTAQEGERTRGGNFHAFWGTELLGWPAKHRREAWAIAAAATRKGAELMLWDTTAKGTNDLIQERLDAAKRDPATHVVMRGSSAQNPLLSRKFLRDLLSKFTGQRLREEAFGEIFDRASGALWGLDDIAERRVSPRDVPALTIKLWAHDPAFSDDRAADEVGLVGAGRAANGTVYILEDASGPYSRGWAATIVDGYLFDDYAGVVTETNRGGHASLEVLIAECKTRRPALDVKIVPRDKGFERRIPGTLQVKEVQAAASKMVRGEGARVYGNVRHAGMFAELEEQLTTYDGTGRSPGRFDAFNYAVNELADLSRVVAAPAPPPPGYGAMIDLLRTPSRRSI
jgi:phage terminase large subunit-like protein